LTPVSASGQHASKLSYLDKKISRFLLKDRYEILAYFLTLEVPISESVRDIGQTFETFFIDLKSLVKKNNSGISLPKAVNPDQNNEQFLDHLEKKINTLLSKCYWP
jgi:hypothetical protein